MIPLNEKQVRIRIYILIGFLCAVLCAFLLRLVQWQLIDGESYLARAESTSTYAFSATAARGEIVDCYGRSLATNIQLAYNNARLAAKVAVELAKL